jgi:hypothetical protein
MGKLNMVECDDKRQFVTHISDLIKKFGEKVIEKFFEKTEE